MNAETPIIEAAKRWKGELIPERATIEKARQLPESLAQGMLEDGFHSMLVPEAYGGLEVNPHTFVDVLQILAQGDASAAWCAMIGATSAMTSAYLAEDTARQIFVENGPSIHAGVFAPMGMAVSEGEGYRVSGRWQWGSGSPNARYIWGGCVIVSDGSPELLPNGMPRSRMMMFERSDVELLDTWDVMGLCGTGSNDFAVANLFVHHANSVDIVHDTPVDRPLYKFPVLGLLATGVCSVCLGIARALVDELIAKVGSKTPMGSRKSLANRPTTQSEVARAEMELRSARAWLDETIESAWLTASKGDTIPVEQRRDLRLAAVNAAKASASCVTRMYELGGGTSVYKTSPLQQHFRDVHVATQHMLVGNTNLEQAGRLFLGLDSDSTMI